MGLPYQTLLPNVNLFKLFWMASSSERGREQFLMVTMSTTPTKI